VPPVTEDSPGRVADGSEPTVETGPEPEVVEAEGLPDDPESVPVVDGVVVDPDDVVDVPVEASVEEVVEPVEELDDSDELDDESESVGVANAVPIPPVPTNPTTPSEKARAPNLNACFCELTYSPNFGALDP
jgi:hypothetical protein